MNIDREIWAPEYHGQTKIQLLTLNSFLVYKTAPNLLTNILKISNLNAWTQKNKYNVKWADMEADVNEDSDIWIDLITQDHSKFAELLTQYELPKLGRLRIMNVTSNMNIFEDLMLKSLKSSVKQLYITSSDLNHSPIDKTFNILSRIKDNVTQELWLGHFTMTIEQMNTIIQKYSHLVQITFNK